MPARDQGREAARRKHQWAPCDYYHAYEAARSDAADALAEWCAAPCGAKRDAFLAYRAAADREDAAAWAWMHACENYDRERLADAA